MRLQIALMLHFVHLMMSASRRLFIPFSLGIHQPLSSLFSEDPNQSLNEDLEMSADALDLLDLPVKFPDADAPVSPSAPVQHQFTSIIMPYPKYKYKCL